MFIRRVLNTPDWGFRSPFDEFDRLQRQMDLLGNRLLGRGIEQRAGVFPLINLSEDKDHYYVRAELPGLKADEIDIQATGNTISLNGERKIPAENDGAKYHRREREAGKFSRVISLSKDIDADNVDANLVDGVLKVVLPKSEKAKPKQISVK
jgi:HSP20 family protein